MARISWRHWRIVPLVLAMLATLFFALILTLAQIAHTLLPGGVGVDLLLSSCRTCGTTCWSRASRAIRWAYIRLVLFALLSGAELPASLLSKAIQHGS